MENLVFHINFFNHTLNLTIYGNRVKNQSNKQ